MRYISEVPINIMDHCKYRQNNNELDMHIIQYIVYLPYCSVKVRYFNITIMKILSEHIQILYTVV